MLRLASKTCARRITTGLPRFTMASPFRSLQHDSYSLSSSPGLPSLDQIQSQAPARPPIRSGSAAMQIPDDANRNFTSASSFLRQEQSAIDLTTPCKPSTESFCQPPPPLPEDDVEIISLAFVTKPKRKRGVKVLEKKPGQPPPKAARSTKASKEKEETEADQPWKKYLKDAAEKEEKKAKAAKTKAPAKASKKKGETASRHFTKSKSKDEAKDEEIPAPLKKDSGEPLELDAAMRRRMDWTPPPADTASGSNAQVVDLLSSVDKSSSFVASKETFDNLFKNFGRPEDEPPRPSVEPPDGDNPILRKRKLIETVSINDSAKAATSDRVPPKPKATRKKPRTITELATAAYVVPDATEQEDPSELPLESVEGDAEAAKGKGKKRPSRAKKPKKMPPPEPVLLSPTAALRQAANQDYVFGTSSQLAREHSPTFLRDLQSAIQASNSRLKQDDHFVTPINSDAIEPEPRQKLWGVGARDEDGRVLDLEVIDLANTPKAAGATSEGPNPFGYVAAEKQPPPLPNHFPSEDSFPDIDDLLGKGAAGDLPRGQKEASPFFSTARPVTAQSEQGQAGPVDEIAEGFDEDDIDLPPPRLPSVMETKAPDPVIKARPTTEPSKPKFELYTDVQLAREISSYGFKPVKRRTAMLSLLDQCWASKQRPALSSLPMSRPISTTSESQAAAKLQTAASVVSPKRPPGRPRKNSIDPSLGEPSPKRPRGRPRKNGSVEPVPKEASPKRSPGRPRKVVEVEVMSSEPPPSAQPPPPSPKRSRGRPKRAVEPSQSSAAPRNVKGKSKMTADIPVIPETGVRAASPRGKRRKSQEVIEIPDSASEGSISLSPFSSPEPTFSSPPPVDVSLSVGEDTEISLAASPKTQEDVALFQHITEAVTTAPPAIDPKKPSFHEMMLMYDPIILEDLATWLNTGQLSRVGYDGEVSPTEVKQWSGCCETISDVFDILSSQLSHANPFVNSISSTHQHLKPLLNCDRNVEPRPKSDYATHRRLNSDHTSQSRDNSNHVAKASFIFSVNEREEGGTSAPAKFKYLASIADKPGITAPSGKDINIVRIGAQAKERHEDGPAYRLGAIRECFEETGILLATKKGSEDASTLVNLPSLDRDAARKQIHGNQVRFNDWVEKVGGVPDVDRLIPFTRWVTPTNVPKRFTTQMYLYMLPHSASTGAEATEHEIIVPTPDGGVEHTAAKFDDASVWLSRADKGEIILFPPQYYLLFLVSQFCKGASSGAGIEHFAAQREQLRRFLERIPTVESEAAKKQPTSQIPWSDKVMSPHNLFIREDDNRVVLGIDKPGPELKGSGRGGDWERVVLVKFTREGPRSVEVRGREEVLREEKESKTAREEAEKSDKSKI
ncbi:AT hook domain-containing protein [Colletotrichum karsti]|uniref:Structure-specific endonuclease subunit SLX4 n=1 Tax=Colletotrichum karsti TaxID=1095194 RepID=A0A9P6LHD5_9PEZI|nr:AT hook domain-containing protein [Colletotrichum karsti]KAF9872505.1 AT hook domain-containing protein [Colletotrichum karsti]